MAEPLRLVQGIAAPLPLENVDTDMIWPGNYKSLRRGDQAANAFRRLRFNSDGSEISDFILNRPPWRSAQILVAGDNFGCGSSREMAVWALHEWGLRCIIAPRFGDIFRVNCCLNGLLPVQLDAGLVAYLLEQISNPAMAELTVDLESCRVSAGVESWPFELESRLRLCLLDGLDQLELAVRAIPALNRFGIDYHVAFPWTTITAGQASSA